MNSKQDIYWGLSSHEFKNVIWQAHNIFLKEDDHFADTGVIGAHIIDDMAAFVKLRVANKATRIARHGRWTHLHVDTFEAKRKKLAEWLSNNPEASLQEKNRVQYNLRLLPTTYPWTQRHHQDIGASDVRGWVKKFVLK
jgi:hypothetical protein